MPNGSRLTCGAVMNNSLPNLRAPEASSAGYAPRLDIPSKRSVALIRCHIEVPWPTVFPHPLLDCWVFAGDEVVCSGREVVGRCKLELISLGHEMNPTW